MTTTVPAPDAATRSLAERAVDAITARLSRRPVSRRRFLQRATVAASALAVDPVRYVLRPQSAYATVCGSGNTCGGGWTAFCCTINDGANTCPPGSYAAGWWKVDTSSFCKGAPRFYIDCNRLPDASCTCTCADGACDQRKVCCNVFRYGQCHLEVPGVTEVVCRVITCTVPWEWDEACSDTVRTDNRTATHSATCLPGPDASWIEIRYQDLGLVGSVLGAQTRRERDVPGGRRADYEHGLIAWSDATGAHALDHGIAARFDALDGVAGRLGFPTTDAAPLPDGRGRAATFQHGVVVWSQATGAHALWGPILDRYQRDGGPTGWLGYPTSEITSRPGPWRVVTTDEQWMVVRQTERDEVRVLPAGVELPEDGSWPPMVRVERWAGPDRFATAVAVAEQAWPDGATVAFLASGREFADALAGGVAAARRGGPLLLTEPDHLPDVVADALGRLGVRRVVVLGGPVAVADEVLDALREQVRDVDRWSGPDRYATAVRISRQVFRDEVPVVHVATGEAFADALAAAPAAAAAGGPVLLVEPDRVPDVVVDEISRLAPQRIVILGGPAAIRRDVEDRLAELAPEVVRRAGDDRYATAAELARAWVGDDAVETVLVASGEDFPDGLGAGAAAALLGAPVLLATADGIPDPTWDAYAQMGPQRVVVVGGTDALSGAVQRHLAALPADDASSAPAGTPG